jgi:hypothetical protein
MPRLRTLNFVAVFQKAAYAAEIVDSSSKNAANFHWHAQRNAFRRRAMRVGNPDGSPLESIAET